MLNCRELLGPKGPVGHSDNQCVSGIVVIRVCDDVERPQLADGFDVYLTRPVPFTLKLDLVQRREFLCFDRNG